MRKHSYLSFNWTRIKASGLLSPERIAELETIVEKSKATWYNAEGKALKFGESKWQPWTLPDGYSTLTLCNTEHASEYGLTCIISRLLTDDEFNLIEEQALESISAEREKQRLAAARREWAATYEHGVWWGDDYYSSVDDLYDAIANHDELIDDELVVWGSTGREVLGGLDLGDMLQHVVEDRGWEDMEIDDLYGVVEFEAALEKFKKENERVRSYEPDFKLALVIPAEKVRELQSELYANLEKARGGPEEGL